MTELIDYARASPGKISFASAGTGGTAHLGMEMFKALSKTDVLYVPYKGSSAAVNDLISGEVSAMLSSLPSLQGLVDKGLVKVLAATAPLATPKPVVDTINAALNKALKAPALVAKIAIE